MASHYDQELIMATESVEEYIEGLPEWQATIAIELRKIVRNAAPEAEERFKWSQPVYEQEGPFCYFKGFKNSVNFGFWRGVDLEDPKKLLIGSGEKMRHVKITKPEEIDRGAFTNYVKQAVQLNLIKGDPSKG
jgi:hypothetical protein